MIRVAVSSFSMNAVKRMRALRDMPVPKRLVVYGHQLTSINSVRPAVQSSDVAEVVAMSKRGRATTPVEPRGAPTGLGAGQRRRAANGELTQTQTG